MSNVLKQNKVIKENFGRESEKKILKEYLSDGYELVAMNFQYYAKGRSGRKGEIDLIVKKNKVLVLIEVKARNNERFGSVLEQVNYTKIQAIKKTYNYFIACHLIYKNYFVRVDLASIYKGEVSIIKNAVSFDL